MYCQFIKIKKTLNFNISSSYSYIRIIHELTYFKSANSPSYVSVSDVPQLSVTSAVLKYSNVII